MYFKNFSNIIILLLSNSFVIAQSNQYKLCQALKITGIETYKINIEYGDTTRVIYSKEQLNKLGYPTKTIKYDSIGIKKYNTMWTYKNDSLCLSFFNECRDHKMIYDYNHEDKVISITNFLNGTPSAYETFSYRKDGRIKTNSQYAQWSQKRIGFNKRRLRKYKYNDKTNEMIILSSNAGKRIKIIYKKNSDNIHTQTITDYKNPNGFLMQKTMYDSMGNILVQEYFYRSSGTMDDGVRKIIYNEGDTLKFQNIYGINGLKTNRIIYKNNEVVDTFEYKYLKS